jgi:enoyl-CoA hydratase/carnithine racemase
MAYEALEVKQDGAIAWLTLNRPHVLNALNSTMVSESHDYLDRLASDRTARVVVVRGAGRAFCAGLDLKEHSGARPGDDTLGGSTSATLEIQRRISGLVIAIRRLPQPFIAAVHGPASGGGFALALACDVRLAGASARFNAAFIRIGLTGCDMGISYTLARGWHLDRLRTAAHRPLRRRPARARRAHGLGGRRGCGTRRGGGQTCTRDGRGLAARA